MVELIVAFLFVAICFILSFISYHCFFLHIVFLVLLPLVLFFWLYLNYFHEILPVDVVTNLILLSILLILFPFLLFQIIAVTLGLLIIKKLKNQQNHAFLLTKSSVGTFGETLNYLSKNIFIFFSCLSEKNILFHSTTMAFVCLNSHLDYDDCLPEYLKND